MIVYNPGLTVNHSKTSSKGSDPGAEDNQMPFALRTRNLSLQHILQFIGSSAPKLDFESEVQLIYITELIRNMTLKVIVYKCLTSSVKYSNNKGVVNKVMLFHPLSTSSLQGVTAYSFNGKVSALEKRCFNINVEF